MGYWNKMLENVFDLLFMADTSAITKRFELETVKRMRRADISVVKFDCN